MGPRLPWPAFVVPRAYGSGCDIIGFNRCESVGKERRYRSAGILAYAAGFP
jgi:hypothetical protein